ncbi:unnamed protein product [Discula destructiva]
MGKKWRWGVVLDAGSSGTRLHIYKWKDPAKARKHASKAELHSLPKLETEKKWTKKIKPGVSTFGDNPTAVGRDHLKGLIDHALDIIPKDQIEDTPIFLMATAGMRLLPKPQQSALTSEICSYLRSTTEFSLPDCGLHIQVIPGETEGLYGWIATNYLLGGFDRPEDHDHGKGHNTYGFLDMGGASAQIAFAPNATEAAKHADDLKLLRMRTLDGQRSEYKVFTATWLGFGVNQAHESYVSKLVETYDPDAKEIPDPCLPKGLRTTTSGKPVDDAKSDSLTLLGTGDFTSCLKHTYPLLGKDAPCLDQPCLLNGQHVPAIDFDVNHFVGVSEYWHTTHGVFGGKKGDTAYDLKSYQTRVEEFCASDWGSIADKVDVRKKQDKAKEAQEACFKASWLINVLHDGIGIPRLGLEHTTHANASKGALEDAKQKGFLDPFQPVDKVDGIEVSWTLGPMVLYAAGQIPPKSHDYLPVGFGSNTLEVPADFNHAGSKWEKVDGDDDWDDALEDLVDHAKPSKSTSFLFFILALMLVGYLFRKKERRMRFMNKFNSFTGRPKKPGSPRRPRGLAVLTSKFFGRPQTHYERIVEEGDISQFELGDVDSDDNEHSDSSEGSHLGRTSGLATPKLASMDRFDTGSALDRAGLFVRTESRERLMAPTMSTAGRRSRAGSPTRHKSPLMSPLQED